MVSGPATGDDAATMLQTIERNCLEDKFEPMITVDGVTPGASVLVAASRRLGTAAIPG